MSNFVKELNETEFKSLLETTDKVILVDFWASWCNPCRMQTPIIHELADDLQGRAEIVKINVDENEKLAFEYKIISIPCLMVFKDGELKEKTVGLSTKAELSEMLIKYI